MLRRNKFTPGLLVALAVLSLGGAGFHTPVQAQQASYSSGYAQDRAEIEDLMARYLFAMDWGDLDAYAATFTEDGRLDYASGSAQGRQAIKETVQAFKDRISKIYVDADGNPAKLRHVVAQTVIRVEGNQAWSTALWYEMANNGPDGAPSIGTYGTYEDELEKVDGQWLFKRRLINNEFLKGRGTGDKNPVRTLDEAALSEKHGEISQ